MAHDPDRMKDEQARPRGQRLAALCAIALIALSCGLLRQMSDGARPIQSMGWFFGPAAAAADRF
jgi:hypothetical protein